MCMILQSGGHGHSHGGHSHSSVTTASPRRTASVRRPADTEDQIHFADSHDDMVTMTTRMTSTDESPNINVKAAFIHVIGDLLQSFGVLVAAYIIFYKVARRCRLGLCRLNFLLLEYCVELLVEYSGTRSNY